MQRIEIYDTTLRDGSQSEGVSFSLQDKMLICHRLDELGVDFIEGGYPLSNPKDAAFFQEARGLKLQTAKLLAFGMTRRKGLSAAEDVGLKALRDAQTEYVTVVGKTWDLHVTEVLGVSLQENLDMIADSVAYLTGEGRKVIYDAEHFFDGFKANPDYALKTIAVAAQAGAVLVCLCDTNGGSLPEQVTQCVRQARHTLSTPIGIHPHNDSGLAVANALAAVAAGAVQVQGTINGIGERCGNVDITTVIANLRLKMGYDCLKKDSLIHLTETSKYIYEIANLNLVNNQPYTGASAFAHKGGMHVHAVNKIAGSYEHVVPELVGNSRRILVSELSGVSNIAAKAGKKFNILHDRDTLKKVLDQITELENQGYQFEAAEASFELIVRRQIGRLRKFFDLKSYRCAISRQANGKPVTKATLSVIANKREINASAEGDGPINALDAALRYALEPEFPAIADLHLVDYKVRVVNGRAESAAKVRVIIEFRSPEGVFGTIGVSENIIEASWQAIADAVEYRLIHAEEAAAKVPPANAAV
ncbi:MAG: citramalate synthase [Planctomycetes bacterium]|jgi:2-isopropylmalate synthase|nr:citramalate synthase [Planctomycetota bacterium]MDA8378762.1 citramalate synthase [Planctomycetia bacterium]